MNCGSRNAKENLYDGMRAMNNQTLLEHSERMAKQEERMNAHQANCEGALDRLRAHIADQNAYMAKRDAQRDADAAKRDADAAKRDKDNTRWQIGMWAAAVLILGAWIRWPF